MPPEPSSSVVALDLAHLVHHMAPRLGRETPPVLMKSGQGLRLCDIQDHEYLDAVSGMFTANIGYGRRELAQVMAEDAARLGFAPLYGRQGNVPAAQLAGKLAEITPPGIEHFFFTVGGSDAVETAIKFARLFHSAHGQPGKTQLLARRGSYHGMSLGALSATGQPAYWAGVGPRVAGFEHIKGPRDAIPGGLSSRAAADRVEEATQRLGPEGVAGFLVEPISLTNGIHPPSPAYLKRAREICDRHGMLLIVDEAITGFGRTGEMFALDHWGIEPDLLLMAKGITSGYLPLGAVGMSRRVFEAIVSPDQRLLHGFSAGGHPTACAVALENIRVIEDEQLVARSRSMGNKLLGSLTELATSDPRFSNPRGLGLMAAIDLESDETAERVAAHLWETRTLVRRYGRSIALGPALIATEEDINEIVGRIVQAGQAFSAA